MLVDSSRSEIYRQAGKLEIQGRFDVAVLNPNSAGQSVGNSGRVPVLHS